MKKKLLKTLVEKGKVSGKAIINAIKLISAFHSNAKEEKLLFLEFFKGNIENKNKITKTIKVSNANFCQPN